MVHAAAAGTDDAGLHGGVSRATAVAGHDAAVSGAITALLGWLFWVAKTKFNVDIEAKHREALTAFLTRSASSLVAEGAIRLNGTKVDISNESLASAANAAITAIPDALKFFNLTPDHIKHRILDLIPQQPAVAGAIAVAMDVKNPQTPSAESATGGTA